MTSLKFFRKDPTRDLMYAGVEGYQMDLSPIVKVAKNLGHEVELPSWAKLTLDQCCKPTSTFDGILA